jgi:hypothetical protein
MASRDPPFQRTKARYPEGEVLTNIRVCAGRPGTRVPPVPRGHVHGTRSTAVLALIVAPLLVSGCRDAGTGASQRPAGRTAVAAVNGNGVEGLSAAQILDRASTASSAATSVHLRGRFRSDGRPASLDLRVSGKQAAIGDITMNGARIGLVRIGSTLYIKGDDRFWRSAGGQSAVRMLSGKYLKTRADDKDFREFMSFTFMSKVFAQLVRPKGTLSKGAHARINGREAIALADGGGGSVYVATTGEPEFLRLSSGGETFDFLDYGKKVEVHPPARGRVIDVDGAK